MVSSPADFFAILVGALILVSLGVGLWCLKYYILTVFVLIALILIGCVGPPMFFSDDQGFRDYIHGTYGGRDGK